MRENYGDQRLTYFAQIAVKLCRKQFGFVLESEQGREDSSFYMLGFFKLDLSFQMAKFEFCLASTTHSKKTTTQLKKIN